MVAAAQRNGELIADLAAKGAVLGKAQVMGITGRAVADQARLLGHEPNVLLVANAARLGMGQMALVDLPTIGWCFRGFGSPSDYRCNKLSGCQRQRRVPVALTDASDASLAANTSST